MSIDDCSLICGGDSMRSEGSGKKSILNTNPEKPKTEKSVTIVEPTAYVCEKKIRELRLKVDELIVMQIEKRKEEFIDLKNASLPSKVKIFGDYLLKALLVFLLFTMVKASICHSQNCYCEVYWYETLLAGVFGIFHSTYKDTFPS
ncbi:uncharacterized protein LOC128987996 [Macrosteles quadrilineatus]|uniref:uncharacterized protein LOC128987996 n=1 Tax=Macrosteles quadrilineatus TaxID=74068 RepID=UPI0023E11491|nr:uncharacterized protein LOC128987996 [Macrosteles quadrilineatus]